MSTVIIHSYVKIVIVNNGLDITKHLLLGITISLL